jgi:membrane-bound lytic murein transglycosylase B
VWGDRTRKAVKKYRKTIQELLRQKGFYSGKIDGELGEQSVNAIQAFQRRFNLRNDGVPDRQTYAALRD